MSFRTNFDEVDAEAAASSFQRDRRVRVANFLSETDRGAAYESARTETPWNVVFHDGTRTRNHMASDYAKLPVAERASVDQQVIAIARDGFGLFYLSYRLEAPEIRAANPGVRLNAMLELVQSPEVLEWVRTVTGLRQIVSATAQATCDAPGHFLNQHNDLDESRDRVVAYVISLSPLWRRDWGGVTWLTDRQDGDVVAAVTPRPSAITLFEVPQWHSVSMVTPMAATPRFSITGWFVDREADELSCVR